MNSLLYIDYVSSFEWPSERVLGVLSITPYTLSLMAAVVVGSWALSRRALRIDVQPETLKGAAFVALWVGLLGAHGLQVALHYYHEGWNDPLRLLRFWKGGELFVGWMFAGLAAVGYSRVREGVSARQTLNAFAWAWPFAWFFVSVGRFLTHGDPGKQTPFFLAMEYPIGILPGGAPGPHHNVALYEAMMAGFLIAVFLLLARRERNHPMRCGVYLGWLFALYCPTVLALDFIRLGVDRYHGLTVDQYLATIGFFAGLWLLFPRRRTTLPVALSRS